jgi:hypothetical protein
MGEYKKSKMPDDGVWAKTCKKWQMYGVSILPIVATDWKMNMKDI